MGVDSYLVISLDIENNSTYINFYHEISSYNTNIKIPLFIGLEKSKKEIFLLDNIKIENCEIYPLLQPREKIIEAINDIKNKITPLKKGLLDILTPELLWNYIMDKLIKIGINIMNSYYMNTKGILISYSDFYDNSLKELVEKSIEFCRIKNKDIPILTLNNSVGCIHELVLTQHMTTKFNLYFDHFHRRENIKKPHFYWLIDQHYESLDCYLYMLDDLDLICLDKKRLDFNTITIYNKLLQLINNTPNLEYSPTSLYYDFKYFNECFKIFVLLNDNTNSVTFEINTGDKVVLERNVIYNKLLGCYENVVNEMKEMEKNAKNKLEVLNIDLSNFSNLTLFYSTENKDAILIEKLTNEGEYEIANVNYENFILPSGIVKFSLTKFNNDLNMRLLDINKENLTNHYNQAITSISTSGLINIFNREISIQEMKEVVKNEISENEQSESKIKDAFKKHYREEMKGKIKKITNLNQVQDIIKKSNIFFNEIDDEGLLSVFGFSELITSNRFKIVNNLNTTILSFPKKDMLNSRELFNVDLSLLVENNTYYLIDSNNNYLISEINLPFKITNSVIMLNEYLKNVISKHNKFINPKHIKDGIYISNTEINYDKFIMYLLFKDQELEIYDNKINVYQLKRVFNLNLEDITKSVNILDNIISNNLKESKEYIDIKSEINIIKSDYTRKGVVNRLLNDFINKLNTKYAYQSDKIKKLFDEYLNMLVTNGILKKEEKVRRLKK